MTTLDEDVPVLLTSGRGRAEVRVLPTTKMYPFCVLVEYTSQGGEFNFLALTPEGAKKLAALLVLGSEER